MTASPVPSISVKDRVSEAEWQTRVDLAACYRLIALYGMSDLIYNHITARVPGEPGHVLINPFGYLYEEMTASALFKIDLDGNIVDHPGIPFGINHAGYIIHSAVHAVRHDLACVIHTHTRAGVAVSVMECGLMPATLQALRFHERLAYHAFEGPAIEEGERERLAEHLGDCDAMILRNHGLLTGGRTIGEAFVLMQRLDNACKIQLDYMAANTPIVMPTPEVMAKSARVSAPPTFTGRTGNEAKLGDWAGDREWAALLRRLDRIDPSYRD